MKKISIFRRLLWQGMLFAVPVLFLIGFAMRPSISEGSQGGYDINESIAKLKAIGKALQIYRAEYGYLPVEQRKNYSDAGLPPFLSDALMDSGFAWSVPKDTFYLSHPNDMHQGKCLSFTQLYVDSMEDYESSYEYKKYGDLRELYAKRGEALPILMDFNMLSGKEMAEMTKFPVLILRLNGEVEQVEYLRDKPFEIYNR
ncbi:MAG TPA: hypothetical protein VNK96_09010 [Fimbriimonadales bacterium]|nr:hypothetical protein [Fimbriimonadales bacterium]